MVDLLPPYTIVRFPFDFLDGNLLELKRFIVIGHVNGSAILIKTTSSVEYYQVRPELLSGVVVCTAEEYQPFKESTVIDPAKPLRFRMQRSKSSMTPTHLICSAASLTSRSD
jgi:hypothetical protein